MNNCIPKCCATQCRAPREKVIQESFLRREKLPLALGRGSPRTGNSECRGTEAGTLWLIVGSVYLECREGGRRRETTGLSKQLAARLWRLKRKRL